MAGGILTYNLKSNTISGSVAGKLLHCAVRPTQAGPAPPAGDYEILSPVRDPMYGLVAVMVPSHRGIGWGHGPTAVLPYLTRFEPVQQTRFEPPQQNVMAGLQAKDLSQTAEVFIFSDKPIPGRNGLVLVAGHGDFMGVLQLNRGAAVKVS